MVETRVFKLALFTQRKDKINTLHD